MTNFHYVVWTFDIPTNQWVVHSGHSHLENAEAVIYGMPKPLPGIRITEERVIAEWP